jgi:hypothetical protein
MKLLGIYGSGPALDIAAHEFAGKVMCDELKGICP